MRSDSGHFSLLIRSSKYRYFGISWAILIMASAIEAPVIYFAIRINPFWSHFIPKYHLVPVMIILTFVGLGSLGPVGGFINYLYWYRNCDQFLLAEQKAFYSFTNFNVFCMCLEIVFEAIPQILLQTYVVMTEIHDISDLWEDKIKVISIVSSLVSISRVNIKIFERAYVQHYWFNRFPGWFTQLMFTFFTTFARILSVTLLVMLNVYYFVLFIILKCVFFMTLSFFNLYTVNPFEDKNLEGLDDNVRSNQIISNVLLTFIISLLSIVIYPSPLLKYPYSFVRFSIYFAIYLIENIGFVLVYQYWGKSFWFTQSAMSSVIYLHAIGFIILAMTPILFLIIDLLDKWVYRPILSPMVCAVVDILSNLILHFIYQS